MRDLSTERRIGRSRGTSLQERLRREAMEGEVAIELVARGTATRVGLHNLRYATRIASRLAEIAAAVGVELHVEDDQIGPPSIIVGPRRGRANRDAR
jgi:hypothetical protein